jgi:hypothetical protein
MMMLSCQGSTNYCLKNPFELLELLFVAPWIVINIFCMKKLHWWEGNFGRCFMKIRSLMVWTPYDNCTQELMSRNEIHHYSRCDGLWESLVQSCGFGVINILFKWESQFRCKFLPHGNKGTKKQHYATRQVVSNVKAPIMKCVDVMPHQMKGIGDGWQDVWLVILETWKSVREQIDEVHKAILNPTYAKTSFMFPNHL